MAGVQCECGAWDLVEDLAICVSSSWRWWSLNKNESWTNPFTWVKWQCKSSGYIVHGSEIHRRNLHFQWIWWGRAVTCSSALVLKLKSQLHSSSQLYSVMLGLQFLPVYFSFACRLFFFQSSPEPIPRGGREGWSMTDDNQHQLGKGKLMVAARCCVSPVRLAKSKKDDKILFWSMCENI